MSLQKEDQGVVVEALLLEVGDEAADIFVEDIDHRGKDFHAARFPLLIFF